MIAKVYDIRNLKGINTPESVLDRDLVRCVADKFALSNLYINICYNHSNKEIGSITRKLRNELKGRKSITKPNLSLIFGDVETNVLITNLNNTINFVKQGNKDLLYVVRDDFTNSAHYKASIALNKDLDLLQSTVIVYNKFKKVQLIYKKI